MNREQQETTLSLAGYVPCRPTEISELCGVTKDNRFWYCQGDCVIAYPLKDLSRVVHTNWTILNDREVEMLLRELCP